MKEDSLLLVALNMIPDLGSIKIQSIAEKFKGYSEFIKAEPKEFLEIPGIGKKISEKIITYKAKIEPYREIEKATKQGVNIVTLFDKDYPEQLKQIYDPPPVLYIKGQKSILNNKAIAIVGSRKASTYGRRVAVNFAKELALMDINVVSGMARGIDSFAHKGAIEAGGPTTAIFGCGIDIVYPPENSRIMQEIERSGALISEYPPGEEPKSYNFPPRNRIISGASVGVIVVEAGEKSGSLITAHYALEQGREVFAVPGSVFSSNSVGTNKLIKDGAKMVTSMEDIFEELQIYFNTENKRERQKDAGILVNSLRGEEKLIGKALLDGEMHIDKLQQETGLDTGRLNSLLVVMEMKGLVEQLPGKIYRLNSNLKKF